MPDADDATDPEGEHADSATGAGGDPNDAIWKSEEHVAQWVATQEARERRRTEHRQLMADLLPFDEDEAFTFVDLGAGTGAASRVVLDRFPRAEAILAEYSPQMAAEGARALAEHRGRFRYVELDLTLGDWPAEVPRDAAAIVSSLCVHHLPDARKVGLFAEIFEHLAPGGWYLNYDQVRADDPAVEATWRRAGDRQDPESALAREHRTPEEQRRHDNHVRHMSALAPQLAFLRAAGFTSIDVFLKQLDTVIYGGRRPDTARP